MKIYILTNKDRHIRFICWFSQSYKANKEQGNGI